MANDTYIQSNFNSSVWIRRDDINGQQNEIDLAQIRGTVTLPTDENRFNKGCQLIIVDTGEEYNNTSNSGTPNWVNVNSTAKNIYNSDGTLTGNRQVDIDGNFLALTGDVGTTGREVSFGIGDGSGIGIPIVGFGGLTTYNDGTDNYNMFMTYGDLSAFGISPFGSFSGFNSPTSSRRVVDLHQFDDGNVNQAPGFSKQLYNDDETYAQFFNMNSGEVTFGWYQDDGTDIIVSGYIMNEFRNRMEIEEEDASGNSRGARLEGTKDEAQILSEFRDPLDNRFWSRFIAEHNDGVDMTASIELTRRDAGGTVNMLTLTETGLYLKDLPAYDDDTAAGTAGLSTGDLYETTGAGAAPLNAAGIIMRKQ